MHRLTQLMSLPLARLRRWTAPPVFADEDKTREAALFNTLLLVTIGLWLGMAICLAVLRLGYWNNLFIALGAIIVLFGLRALMQRGAVRAAIAIALFWAVTTVMIYNLGTVIGARVVGYVVVTVIATWLGGRRVGVAVCLLSIASIVVLVSAESAGLLPRIVPLPRLSFVLNVSGYLVYVSIVINLARADLLSALARAHAGIAERQRAEVALRELNATLEQRVLERTESLRASEERYRQISELTSEFALALRRNPEGGMTVEWVTSAFPTVTGYSVEELRAANGLLPPLHPADLPIARKFNAQLMTAGVATGEWRILNKAGEVRWVRVRGRGLPDVDGGPITQFVSAIEDITDGQLAEQQLRYQADLLDRVSDAIISADTEWRILSWNHAAEEMYGWRAAEAIGRRLPDVLHTQIAESGLAEVAAHVSRGEVWHGEVREQRRDGAWLTIEATVSLLQDEQGRPIGGVTVNRDITGRKTAERRLRESEERLQLALESADAGAWEWDPATNAAIWSDSNYRVLGYAPHAVEARYENWLAAVHPADRAAAEAAVGESAAGHSKLDTEFRVVWPDGQVRWIRDVGRFLYDDAGRPERMIGLQFDITKHKELMAELRASEERYRTLLMMSPDGISVVDNTGRLLACNEQCARLHGYEHGSEMVGRHAGEFYTPESFTSLFGQVAAVLQSGQDVACDIEAAALRRDGSTMAVECSVARVPWADAPSGEAFVTNFRDVTARKAMLAELAQYRANLEALVQARTRDLQAEIAERVAAHAALQRSEASLAEAERIAHLGSWELNPATGELQLSAELRRLYGFGLEAHSLTLADLDQVTHPDDLAAVKATRERALQSGQGYSNQYRIVRPDGETRVVYVRGEIRRDATGQATDALGTTQDITEQEQIKEALAQRVQELTSLQELGYLVSLESPLDEAIRIYLERLMTFAGLDLIQVFLLQEGRLHRAGMRTRIAEPAAQAQILEVGECLCGQAIQNGRTLYTGAIECDARCTNNYCRACGLHSLAALPLRSRDAIIGALAVGAIAPDAFAGRLAFLETAADMVALRLQSALLHQEIQERAAGLEETVAERTRELQTERDRSQAILETVGESVIVTDLEGQVLFANPATTTLTGYTRDETLGHPLWRHWSAPEVNDAWPKAQEALRNGEAWLGEITGRRKDRMTYTVAVTGTPLYDGGATQLPTGGVWVQRDVTTVKEAERLKNQFVSNVSHELRTPVSIIALGCDNLMTFHDRLDENRRKQMLQDIHEQALLLTSLVEDTLRISQIDSGHISKKKHLLDLALLVRDEAESQRIISGRRSQRLTVSARAPVWVLGNDMQLRQVVRNLLSNAIKYTPIDGQIGCTCEVRSAVPAPPSSGCLAPSPGSWAVVEITDTGIGIAAEDLPFLFDRFYRVNAESAMPGTGLGLATIPFK